ncbi:MAG TPA: serine hydrolase domain-containing protein [Hyphomonadaceae bacterium]|nr:serine hydrolase domain-containing protein [Hyphomonadaceae bacterium]HPN05230.1 serine hydrolase domain-containing protein [Hyphomonadaceae bacterium]
MSKRPHLMGSRLLLAAVSFAVLAACSDNKPAAPAEPAAVAAAPKPSDNPAWPAAAVADPATLGFTAEGLAALDARLAKSVADGDVAGLNYILIKNGDVAAFKSHGIQSGDPKTGAPMTNDSMFRIYSMSKPITGVAMMQLYEQGKWQLDDPISKYVPELGTLKVLTYDAAGKVVMKDGKPVLADPKSAPTMRQLMSHTAGFGYGLCCEDPVNAAFRDTGVLTSANLDEMMTKIEAIPLLVDPGTKWLYSASVDIQGYIVQKLSGQKFGEYLKANIFTPLGMNDTSFFVTEANKPRFTDVYHWDKDKKALVKNEDRPDRPGFTDPNRLESGGGGLVSTTHDYARFTQMFLQKGQLAGATLLKPETVELMRTNAIGTLGVSTDGTRPNGLDGVSFGLDFAIYDEPSKTMQPYAKGTHYWGGAAGTWFWIDPATDLVFVGMIQQMGGFRPDAMNFRNDSAKLVYEAISASAAAPAAAPAAPAEPEPAH